MDEDGDESRGRIKRQGEVGGEEGGGGRREGGGRRIPQARLASCLLRITSEVPAYTTHLSLSPLLSSPTYQAILWPDSLDRDSSLFVLRSFFSPELHCSVIYRSPPLKPSCNPAFTPLSFFGYTIIRIHRAIFHRLWYRGVAPYQRASVIISPLSGLGMSERVCVEWESHTIVCNRDSGSPVSRFTR